MAKIGESNKTTQSHRENEKRHRCPGTAGMREVTLLGSTDVTGSENFINDFLGSLGGSFS